MARPTKRTPEREGLLLEAIRAGATRKAAALHAGIDEATLYRWMERNASFASLLTRAEGESEVALVGIIRKAAELDWRAAAHLLERRWPETWGRRDRVDVTIMRREAERIAQELGIDVDEVLQEAERIMGHGRSGG